MDRYENMNAFVRVVEAGSISAAADRMNAAKSVVSRRLKELEEHLGVELFHRTTRQMNLAAIALAIFTLASAALFHTNFSDQMQVIMFMKNIAIAGGLMLLAVYGAGGYSVNNRRIKSQDVVVQT